MKTAQISAATTVAQFVGVADNGAITKLILDGAADGYAAFYAKLEDKALIGKLETLAAASGNVLDPEAAINTIAAHLAEIKKALEPVKTVDSVVTGDGFLLAPKAHAPIQNEKRFVLSQLRTWGEAKTPKAGGDAYKSVTVDGYYLVDTEQGVEIVSGQFVSNTALFKSFLPEINLTVENQTIDLSEKALAFMIRTDEHIAGVTTYPESSPTALLEAKKKGINPTVNSTTGVTSVLCFHKVSNKAVFRGLGAKINATLSAKLESIALGLLDAKAKAQQEAQGKRVDNQLAIEMSAAETKNLNEKVSGLLDTLSNNSDKIAALGIDAQALMIAALMNK